MTSALPVFYLSILTLFLLILNWLIFKQIETILALESQFKYFFEKSQNGILELEEHLAFAKVCVAKKSFSQAIIESQLALKKNLEFNMLDNNTVIANLYNTLGFIYSEAGQVQLAKTFYKQALQIDPNYVVALNNLAKIYEELKDFKQAESLYDTVLTLQVNNKIASRRKNIIAKMKNV